LTGGISREFDDYGVYIVDERRLGSPGRAGRRGGYRRKADIRVIKRRRTTAQDVARAADVSVATVSLVVNGKAEKRVPPSTRLRVLKAAAALGYTVDRRARGLATGKSGLIGFLVPGLRNPFFNMVHMALLREFGSHYQVLTATTDMGEEGARNIEQMLALGVDAIVAISVDNAYLDPLHAHVPMVLVDTDRPGPGVAAINFTDEKAARQLALHLIELGHRQVIYVDAARARSRGMGLRRRAFCDSFATAGAAPPILVTAEVDIDAVADLVRGEIDNWLAAGATALVCATDLQAYGALVALEDRSIPVPEAISLAGFDDLPLSKVVRPQLTSVSVPAIRLAAVAADELRSMLAGKPAPEASILIDIELQRRGSTGPAPVVASRRTAIS
jgi:LacI family transcriptional regulator